ncbi:HepT-like ribonuclease domain-containing protein [Microbacterium sp. KRD172]|uniref:HepT-like ribonuclease domain-containing protein n=1 Tax=Microbacterium sp. KRD172 TaxID=2729727 RepID=UPI0019CFC6AB|nr:HepT-like ribonuclease domain-containing protein [Microbacterium sp. KRD172]
MNDGERIERWLRELAATLQAAAGLAARGEDAFRNDPALPLAFEALSNRVGDLSKRLTRADPDRFSNSAWRAAARHRDFVVHHYGALDHDLLWSTVVDSFPRLAELVRVQLDQA